MLNVDNLEVRIGGRVLKDSVSFHLKEGEAIRVAGANGAGKSTLLKTLLAGSVKPVKGVSFNIHATLGKTIAYFPQAWGDTIFPWLNTWDNILIGTLKSDNHYELYAKEKLGNLAFQFFPGDLAIESDTKCDPIWDLIIEKFKKHDITKLSGGQQQKIVLLRTLACNPKLMILDEPYRDLDYQSTNALNDYLQDMLDDGCSLLYVSHQDIGITPSEIVNMD